MDLNVIKRSFNCSVGMREPLESLELRWALSINELCYCCCSVFAIPMDCSTRVFPVLHYLLEFSQTYVHWVSDAIQPSHLLPSPSPPAFNLSCIRGFSNESVLCVRWSKYWSFSLSISPSNEYSGLISFRMDWFDNLAVQETIKSLLLLLQHHK